MTVTEQLNAFILFTNHIPWLVCALQASRLNELHSGRNCVTVEKKLLTMARETSEVGNNMGLFNSRVRGAKHPWGAINYRNFAPYNSPCLSYLP